MEGLPKNARCHCEAFTRAFAHRTRISLDLLGIRVLLFVERPGVELHLLALPIARVKLTRERFGKGSRSSSL